MEVTGPAVPMVEEVQSDLVYGSGQFAVSSTGTMIYLSGNADSPGTLVWSDLKGNRRPLFDTPRRYRLPRFSPDGKRLAVQVNGANTDVWILEIDRAVLRRFTYAQETDSIPVWTPDGRKIVFQSNRGGGRANLFWKAADGASEAERLTTSDRTQIPFSWTPDGKVLAFFARSPKTGFDIWTMRIDRDDEPTPFEQTPLTELEPEFSPDGRWLAYMSNETGRHEIYVEPFPGPGRKWQVSTEGGTAPRWSPDGRELYYVNEDRMMAASVRMTPSFNPAKPRLLFEGRFGFGFDVAPDGKSFVLIQPSDEDTGPRQLHVVLNWYDEVRRAVPRGGN